MEIIAKLDKVSYLYENCQDLVLKNISLDIYKGEFLGIIGPTGAGKTTLSLVLNGIVPQFYGGRFFGYAEVAGLDTLTNPVSKLSRYVGAVFEDPETQLLATSVENEIAFTLENLCLPREEILARIARALAAVRLEGMEKKQPNELSGGQKQRLAIARALVNQPDIIIADEPTGNLDPYNTYEVISLLQKINQTGKTIVLATHDREIINKLGKRVITLENGKILRDEAEGRFII